MYRISRLPAIKGLLVRLYPTWIQDFIHTAIDILTTSSPLPLMKIGEGSFCVGTKEPPSSLHRSDPQTTKDEAKVKVRSGGSGPEYYP